MRRLAGVTGIALAVAAASLAVAAVSGGDPARSRTPLLGALATATEDVERALPVPARATAAAARDRALRRALRRLMREAGPASGAWVRDVGAGRLIFARRSRRPLELGSNTKLFTVAAALTLLGPDAALETAVAGDGRLTARGAWSGDLYLVGGGDPSLDGRAIGRLADQVAGSGVRRVTGRVRGDESRLDGRRGTRFSDGERSEVIGGTLSALGADDVLEVDPARWTAGRLGRALERRGIEVRAAPGTGEAPDGARTLAALASPTVAELARTTLRFSSNFYAEMLVKAVGARGGRTGTTARGAAAAERLARRLGAPARLADGAGLSAGSRASARSVGRLVAAMLDSRLRAEFAGAMAVAGQHGTLRDRLEDGAAEGACRAKTGTRPRGTALSGYCRGRGGGTIVFSFVLNEIDPAEGRRLVDRMAEAIARRL